MSHRLFSWIQPEPRKVKARKQKTCSKATEARRLVIEFLRSLIHKNPSRALILRKVGLELGVSANTVRDYCFIPERRKCQCGNHALPSYRRLKKMIRDNVELPTYLGVEKIF
jgi:hypothetical protein